MDSASRDFDYDEDWHRYERIDVDGMCRWVESEAPSIIGHLAKFWLYPNVSEETRIGWIGDVEAFLDDVPDLTTGRKPSRDVVLDALWTVHEFRYVSYVEQVVREGRNDPDCNRRMEPRDRYGLLVDDMKRVTDRYLGLYADLVARYGFRHVPADEVDDALVKAGFITGILAAVKAANREDQSRQGERV